MVITIYFGHWCKEKKSVMQHSVLTGNAEMLIIAFCALDFTEEQQMLHEII